jgi:hypothetical protein
MSDDFGTEETTAACADFLVELRGFEPTAIAGAVRSRVGSPLGGFARPLKAALDGGLAFRLATWPFAAPSDRQAPSCSSCPNSSPDLNPIEQVFAKLKHLLRNAAARTLEALVTAVGELLGTYAAQECANYVANAGYGQA